MDDSNLDEDGWNDGSNYDRIEHLLQDVDGTKEDAEVALTGAKNNKKRKFHSRRLSRYQKCRRGVGSKSNLSAQNRNEPTSTGTTLNNDDEENNPTSHEEDNDILEKNNIFEENDKEVQNILSEVVKSYSFS